MASACGRSSGPPKDFTPNASHSTFLVVNGDDFGYSAAINGAILRCHDDGILRSTSLLVNRPATRAALALARSRPGLGVGLHVNLTEGVSVLPPGEVRTLVDRCGQFLSLVPQVSGLLRGRTNLDEVERELRAQFAILLDAGVRPTHVDGHLHAHAFPGVLEIVTGLMAEFGVRAMRSPLLGAWQVPGMARRPDVADAAQVRHGERLRLSAGAALRTRAMGMVTGRRAIYAGLRLYPDEPRAALLDRARIARAGCLRDAAGFLGAADPALALAEAVGAVDGGMVEVMAHPGWNRSPARGAAEVALLTDPRLPELLAARGVRVGHYGMVQLDGTAAP
jgi:predicted glycoside hydrolase/deacetylase ChbG (UPF0249 family)